MTMFRKASATGKRNSGPSLDLSACCVEFTCNTAVCTASMSLVTAVCFADAQHFKTLQFLHSKTALRHVIRRVMRHQKQRLSQLSRLLPVRGCKSSLSHVVFASCRDAGEALGAVLGMGRAFAFGAGVAADDTELEAKTSARSGTWWIFCSPAPASSPGGLQWLAASSNMRKQEKQEPQVKTVAGHAWSASCRNFGLFRLAGNLRIACGGGKDLVEVKFGVGAEIITTPPCPCLLCTWMVDAPVSEWKRAFRVGVLGTRV